LSRISSAQDPPGLHWNNVYLGVALTTLATLVLELSLTRIFSVVFYYHFAFLAISIALFGLGAGGVFSYVVARRPGQTWAKLGKMAFVNAVVIVLALTFVMTRTGQPGNITLALVYFASACPFFFAGAIVSLAISETIERVDRVYFFDLLGASGGCLFLIPFLELFGGPNTVISAGVLFAVSAAIWYNLGRRPAARAAGVLLALALVALMFLNATYHVIDVKWAKGQEIPHEMFVKWNSFSRIGLIREKGTANYLIVIDADASTGIPPFDWDHLDANTRFDLLHQGPGFPYMIRPGAKALIIGPGGGWDVGRALASGSKDIVGVEINPIIATTIMRQRFPDLSHRLYFRPEVHIHVEDGRSFVRRSTEKYQVLQATLVDTWASTAAGAFALSENNLYTTDAFFDYLTHLTDDGFLAFTRWGFEPPRESLRLLSLAMDAFDRLGEKDAWKHVIVVRENAGNISGWGAQDTVLISRRPFSEDDLARARAGVASSKLEAVYMPGDLPGNAFAGLLRAHDLDAFYEKYPYDVSPVGDDRPFFFYTVQPRDVWDFVKTASHTSADFKINRAVPMLFSVVGVSLAATAVILVLPRLMLGSRMPRDKHVFGFLFYFLFIGAGYILIQVALIQKFVLFLGHPTYALTAIIFAMLLASGVGSFLSRRIVAGDEARWRVVLGLVPVLVTTLAFTASPLTTALVGLPLALKVALTVVLIAPPAFLMGIPFPTGLARLEKMHNPSVRWAWSLNAASSVLGSAFAILLAIYIGLRLTLIIGGLCYFGALLALVLTSARVSSPVTGTGRERTV
jgi:hypothetical protein